MEKMAAADGQELPSPEGWSQRIYKINPGKLSFEKEIFRLCRGLFIESIRLTEGSIRVDGELERDRLQIGIYYSENYRLLGFGGSPQIGAIAYGGCRWDATADALSVGLTFNASPEFAAIVVPPEKRDRLIASMTRDQNLESLIVPVTGAISDLAEFMQKLMALAAEVDFQQIDEACFDWAKDDLLGLASSVIENFLEAGEDEEVSTRVGNRRTIAHQIEDALWKEPAENDADLSTAYFAGQLKCSERTVQLAIQENFHMGFHSLKRTIRLHQVRNALAERTPRQFVGDLALEYEFEHWGRFSGAYKKMFGVSPRMTRGNRK